MTQFVSRNTQCVDGLACQQPREWWGHTEHGKGLQNAGDSAQVQACPPEVIQQLC